MFHVYTLTCPLAGAIFYVGKGNSTRRRLSDHVRMARSAQGRREQLRAAALKRWSQEKNKGDQ